ncbi:MAG: hypothetical protein HYY13_12015 [Nitrospirae bacterium]|nr:hypothetical protein [Nitrospirota bacterium]
MIVLLLGQDGLDLLRGQVSQLGGQFSEQLVLPLLRLVDEVDLLLSQVALADGVVAEAQVELLLERNGLEQVLTCDEFFLKQVLAEEFDAESPFRSPTSP